MSRRTAFRFCQICLPSSNMMGFSLRGASPRSPILSPTSSPTSSHPHRLSHRRLRRQVRPRCPRHHHQPLYRLCHQRWRRQVRLHCSHVLTNLFTEFLTNDGADRFAHIVPDVLTNLFTSAPTLLPIIAPTSSPTLHRRPPPTSLPILSPTTEPTSSPVLSPTSSPTCSPLQQPCHERLRRQIFNGNKMYRPRARRI